MSTSEAKSPREHANPETGLVRIGSRSYLALGPNVDEHAVRAVRRLAAWSARHESAPAADPANPDQSGDKSSLGSQ